MGKNKALHRRFQHPGGFVGLPRRVFDSDEYRSLSLTARCLLDELQNIFRPERNGRLVLSNSNAAMRLGVSPKTITKAYNELQNKGFIELNEDSYWRKKQAREWRITYEICDRREPTDEWKDRK